MPGLEASHPATRGHSEAVSGCGTYWGCARLREDCDDGQDVQNSADVEKS